MKPPRTLAEAAERIVELETEAKIQTSRINQVEREFFVLESAFSRLYHFLISEAWDQETFHKWRGFDLAMNGSKDVLNGDPAQDS